MSRRALAGRDQNPPPPPHTARREGDDVMTARCEPPAEWRDKSGWHWIDASGKPVIAEWWPMHQSWKVTGLHEAFRPTDRPIAH